MRHQHTRPPDFCWLLAAEAQQAQQLQSAKFGGFPAPKLPINMGSGGCSRAMGSGAFMGFWDRAHSFRCETQSFHRNWRCPKNAGTHEKSWIFIELAMIFHEIKHPFYGFHHKPSSYVPQALVATGKLPCQARWVGELPMDVSYKCRSIRGLVTYLVGGLEHLV